MKVAYRAQHEMTARGYGFVVEFYSDPHFFPLQRLMKDLGFRRLKTDDPSTYFYSLKKGESIPYQTLETLKTNLDFL